ncbi:hypothetical protein [Leptospira sarikeiensis]|uniref:Uncharacterized protein n=1 Tax=Leptospira sarikeiensis TaxID=2484943 RepID=A0A4V3JR55_9LEPT|nr:hypothetical protein [Leptospira sarikeiensis]TGL58705.1 hypothetical protein EHQ64_16775 [Leptospira sarikeiensis]
MKFELVVIVGIISVVAWNLALYIIGNAFWGERSYIVYQWKSRIASSIAMIKQSWLTGICSLAIFSSFMLLDIVVNFVKVFSIFNSDTSNPVSNRKAKPQNYTHLSDITILFSVSITIVILHNSNTSTIDQWLFLYLLWRLVHPITTYFQMIFESFLPEKNSPDVLASLPRSFILWIISLIEVSLILSWSKDGYMSLKYITSIITLGCDNCSDMKINENWFRIFGFVLITIFIRNLRNLPIIDDKKNQES